MSTQLKNGMKNIRKRSRGFTTVEIMIVVAIVGFLVAIALPNYLHYATESRRNSCISNLRHISTATEQWALELRKTSSNAVAFSDISPYLKGAVVCPSGGSSFSDSYTITIVGADPSCLRSPQTHIWMGTGLDIANSSGNPQDPPPVSGRAGPPADPPGDNNGNNGNNGNENNNGNHYGQDKNGKK